MKLRLAAGTYVFQTNRVAFKQNDVKPMCRMCNDEDETISDFLLFCKSLETVRKPILGDVCHELFEAVKIDFNAQSVDTKHYFLLDCSYMICDKRMHRGRNQNLDRFSKVEYQ